MARYLTASEAADLRRRTPQALTQERKRGQGPPYIVDGGRILYPEDELQSWLDRHRIDPSLTKSQY